MYIIFNLLIQYQYKNKNNKNSKTITCETNAT